MRNSRFLRATGNAANPQGLSDLIHRQRIGLPEVLLTTRHPLDEAASSKNRGCGADRRVQHPCEKKLVSRSIKIDPPAQGGQVQRKEFPKQGLPKQELPRQEPLKPPKPAAGTIYSERADILNRVATFRAHQVKVGKDRENYYEGMQARIRATLGNQIKPKPL